MDSDKLIDRSQYKEGAWILDHFRGRAGSFLDIGAFDGITNSNTRMLAESGWTGVLIEPSPQAFCHLMKNYECFPNVTLVNAAVSTTPGLVKFHVNTGDCVSADQVSTLDVKHKSKWERGGFPFREILIPAITITELAGLFNRFDFINIDVEGINDKVLASLGYLTPEVLCVESDPAAEVWELMCRRYSTLQVFGGNVIGWS